MAENDPAKMPEASKLREGISIAVIVLAALVLTVIPYQIIVNATGEKANDIRFQVLNTILPIVATWVGTVLAFYFTKENFEAAALAVRQMAVAVTPEQKLRAIPVTDAMKRPDEKILSASLENDKAIAMTLTQLDDHFKKNEIKKVAIVGEKGEVLHLINQGDLATRRLTDLVTMLRRAEAKGANAAENAGQADADRKLGDLLADTTFLPLTKRFAIVSNTTTLSEVKIAMLQITQCEDAFVTETGNPSDKAIGWVDNSILLEKSKT